MRISKDIYAAISDDTLRELFEFEDETDATKPSA